MSTVVEKGRGRGMVVNTGRTTEVGRISAAIASSSTGMTPLQNKLDHLGKVLVLVAMVSCAALVGIGLAWGMGMAVVKTGISLAVSVIPEGLVTVVTLTMIGGMRDMATRNAIVKSLPAVETLGSITTICSDKTGTITEGKMKLEKMWSCANNSLVFMGSGVQPEEGCALMSKGGAAKRRSSIAREGPTLDRLPSLARELSVSDSPHPKSPSVCGATEAVENWNDLDPAMKLSLAVSGVCNNAVVKKRECQAPSATPLALAAAASAPAGQLNDETAHEKKMGGPEAKEKEAKEGEGAWSMAGDMTEIALTIGCMRSTYTLKNDGEKGTNVDSREYAALGSRVQEFAFDSDRKRMSVLVKLAASPTKVSEAFFGNAFAVPEGTTHVLLSKGGTEAIAAICTSYLACNTGAASASSSSSSSASSKKASSIQAMNDSFLQVLDDNASDLAYQGMRVLSLSVRFMTDKDVQAISAAGEAALKATKAAANKDKAKEEGEGDDAQARDKAMVSEAEKHSCYVGLAGIIDPPRAAVIPAIASCHQAGVRVCMITGDHYKTALAISKSVGIFQDALPGQPADSGDRAVNADILAAMSEKQLALMEPFPVVFSRASPEDKMKIVKALQLRGEIVAMTGDGANDAASIKQANAGIAMGVTGTDIAKQAADIVLQDDNFATIVHAIKEGRKIMDNITKFIVYLLGCNSAEVYFVFICICFGRPPPFSPMMILWANIFADIPPSLSLGVEQAEADVMEKPPRDPDAKVLNNTTTMVVLCHGLQMALICFFVYIYLLDDGKATVYAQSVCYLMLCVMQLVHVFCSRSILGSMFTADIFSNLSMVIGFSVAMLFILLGIYVPFLADLLDLTSVDGKEWIIIGVAVVVHVALVELEKFILRLYNTQEKNGPGQRVAHEFGIELADKQ